MAEFKTVVREYARMCNDGVRCDECPISSKNNGSGRACHLFIRNYPEKAERFIMEWAEKNPIMTNRRKFEEVFGFNAVTIFGVTGYAAEWLEEEYKGGNGYD